MDNQSSFSSNSLTPLQKGKACVNCRRRKIKCDGGKPICGQCSRFSTVFGDCEYTEHGPSHGQILEEQISILQARIEELETPSRPGASSTSGTGHRSAPTSPITPSNTMGLGPLLSYFYLQQTSGTSVNETAVNSMPTELPFIVLQALVHNFLHNASCFGFFLDTQAFHDAVTQPDSDGRRLPPVLLNVMYLWGVHLSQDKNITVYEPAFLAHALRSTAGSLSGTHPRTILHSMQASVLLAYYFIRNARFLEAKYHTSAAVSIAVSAGLHRIRAPQDGGSTGIRPLCDALAPPKDSTEEGERIDAFWSVLNLNNGWASTDGAPSNVWYGESGLAIDTPWPLDRRDYVERPHVLPLQSSGTVTKFLGNVPDDATSNAALHAKAAILYEAATRLGARYRSSGIPPNDLEFNALDRKIDAFTPILPLIDSKDMLVVHMLCHGATIQLHHHLAKERVGSRTKNLAAARAIVDILAQTDIHQVGFIDPVLAPLWTSACLVVISEIEHQRSETEDISVESLKKSVKSVIAAMEHFAPHCQLMTAQLDAVRKAYAGAVEEE